MMDYVEKLRGYGLDSTDSDEKVKKETLEEQKLRLTPRIIDWDGVQTPFYDFKRGDLVRIEAGHNSRVYEFGFWFRDKIFLRVTEADQRRARRQMGEMWSSWTDTDGTPVLPAPWTYVIPADLPKTKLEEQRDSENALHLLITIGVLSLLALLFFMAKTA